jgi:hypothetical protein
MVTSALLNPNFFQWFQPGIDFLISALAGSPIQILTASLTQSPAIFAANRFRGKGQQELILKNGGEIDFIPLIIIRFQVVPP